MSEKQAKDLQLDAALEGLDEELSVEELEGLAGGSNYNYNDVRPAWDTRKNVKQGQAAATNPYAPAANRRR